MLSSKNLILTEKKKQKKQRTPFSSDGYFALIPLLHFCYALRENSTPWFSRNGAFVITSWDCSSRHRAHPKRNALGGKGFGGNIFVAHGGKVFAISLTSSFPVCFLFRAMEHPPTSVAELDSDPDSPQLNQSSHDPQWSPMGLHHSLHYHLRHPDDRRPGRNGGVSILLLASHRSKAKASC